MTLELVNEAYRGLTYPWGRRDHPGETPFEVAPGVWWLRFEMPGPVNHIKLWLLEDGDGWTIVTKDRKWTAQFEHTLVVTETGAEILTLP